MKKLIFSILLFVSMFSSCKKYLDIVPDNVATLDYAFRDRTSAEKYLFTCYSYLPPFGYVEEPGFVAGDDLWFHPDLNGFVQRAYQLGLYGNNVTDPIFNYWDGTPLSGKTQGGGGDNLWQGIHDCNVFLENIDQVKGDLDDFEKARWKAEVKFLKAYYHYYLFRLYGPIPIIRKNLPISAKPAEVAVYREPVDSVVNYIASLIDEAVPDLPLTIVDEVSELGRITQPIALTVKAELLVTAASPLFNGNQDYVNMVDNRGVQLFNQTADPNKWTLAAQACKNAIDTCQAAGIQLYEFNNSSLNISDTTRRIIQASAVFTDKWNSERIWGTARFSSNSLQTATLARLDANKSTSVYQFMVPTLKMEELFYSSHGVPINEDVDFDYDNRYQVTQVPAEDKFMMQPNYATARLHLNREARFYGTLAVDGGWWFGLGKLNESAQWPLNFKLGSASGGRIGTERYSVTAIYIKKFTSYLSTYSGTTFQEKRYDFPIYRLADLYLLYAEALNESLNAPNSEVYEYIDKVRERAGLKGVVESWNNYSLFPQKPLSKEGMRDIIHRERNIELAFEGHRFWDLRRWKEAIQNYNQPLQGWNTEATTSADFYQPLTFTHHQYTLRDILWPLKQSSLSVNRNLVQNPGW